MKQSLSNGYQFFVDLSWNAKFKLKIWKKELETLRAKTT